MDRSKLKIGAALALSALLCGVIFAPRDAAGQRETAAPAPKADAKTRSAQSKAVSVHVFLLSEQQPRNPDEYLEARGTRYIYFNSPRLAAPARPLAEPKPRYPSGKLAQRHGAVILQLLINEEGALDHVDVVCSAPPFEKSARDSLKSMKFAPARGRDGPVKSYMLVEFGYGRGFPCARLPD
ncbi:MAG: energy transducer TonB [Betaproteobacteria bacterium]|nr:energy transducer TonB [Betaproteobacteria bacterium]